MLTRAFPALHGRNAAAALTPCHRTLLPWCHSEFPGLGRGIFKVTFKQGFQLALRGTDRVWKIVTVLHKCHFQRDSTPKPHEASSETLVAGSRGIKRVPHMGVVCAHCNRNAAALVGCKQILRGHRTEAQHGKGAQCWNSALSPMALHCSDNCEESCLSLLLTSHPFWDINRTG